MKHNLSSYVQRFSTTFQQSSWYSFVQTYSSRLFPLFAFFFITLLISVSMYKIVTEHFYRTPNLAYSLQAELDTALQALADIDAQCSVLSINADHTRLDFLATKECLDSEVGCFHLAHPQRWSGPYLPAKTNAQCELVRAHDGLYIVPATHVVLPSRRTMGVDVIITSQTEMKPLLSEGGALFFDGKPLARKVEFAAAH